jgi:hypothetical protein
MTSDDENAALLSPEQVLWHRLQEHSIRLTHSHVDEIHFHRHRFRTRIDHQSIRSLYPAAQDWRDLNVYAAPVRSAINELEREEGGFKKGVTEKDKVKLEGGKGVFQNSAGAIRELNPTESRLSISDLEVSDFAKLISSPNNRPLIRYNTRKKSDWQDYNRSLSYRDCS